MNRQLRNGSKKRTNVTLDEALLAQAKDLGLNVSEAAEQGLAAKVREELGKRWLEENAEGIEYLNRRVRENGLPLEKHRLF